MQLLLCTPLSRVFGLQFRVGFRNQDHGEAPGAGLAAGRNESAVMEAGLDAIKSKYPIVPVEKTYFFSNLSITNPECFLKTCNI